MFNITNNKGFQITFNNGWTVSVQWGRGNYCKNGYFNGNYGDPVPACPNAEIAAWDVDGRWHRFQHDNVEGWVSPIDVLSFMNDVASR